MGFSKRKMKAACMEDDDGWVGVSDGALEITKCVE